MTTPIWFLDIDGVINSIGMPTAGDGVDPADYTRVTVATSDGTVWPIHYSRVVVDFINEISRAGLVEIRWLTTWQQDARLRFAPAVGLDEFAAYDEDFDPAVPWWKEKVVHDTLDQTDRPFIWTDDDIECSIGERVQQKYAQDSLIIRPSGRPGLTPKHLDAIRLFASKR